jgi:DNA-directed RNA polymerase II subunit RPB2
VLADKTFGVLLHRADMPFTKEGLQPDLIINPNAIPSRMTIGQLLECVLSKLSAIEGHASDASPFDNVDIDEVRKRLAKHGYNESGYETMYCGMTGRKIDVLIFLGPTYYLRLKHMVSDKIHSRARGPIQLLTRQPLEGRSKDGGLRFGEMERDVCISYGIGQFLKERFSETSDKYKIKVCNKCGLFASKLINKDLWGCSACNNYTDVSTIKTHYAFKLLLQELQSVNILGRIRTKRNIFYDGV